MLKLYISPSNQKGNKFAHYNTNEREEAEKCATLIKKYLDNYDGVDCYITNIHENDNFAGRPDECKNKGYDYYLSLHSNASGVPNSTARGVVCFYNTEKTNSAKTIAQFIRDNLKSACPVKSNRAGDLFDGITGWTKTIQEVESADKRGLKVILVERDFHDYEPTEKWLIYNQGDIAKCIADSFVKYFNLKVKQPTDSIKKIREDLDSISNRLKLFE